MRFRRHARLCVLALVLAGAPSVLAVGSPQRPELAGAARQRLLDRVVLTDRLQERLEERFGARLGPSYFSETPAGRVYTVGIIGRTAADDRLVQSLVGMPGLVEVRTARHTFDQLRAFADRTGKLIAAAGHEYSYIQIEMPFVPGRIVVGSGSPLPEPVRQRVRAAVPVGVDFQSGTPLTLMHDTSRLDYPPYEAGLNTTIAGRVDTELKPWGHPCTSGYTAYSWDTRRYYGTTAGHCGPRDSAVLMGRGDAPGVGPTEVNAYYEHNPVISDSTRFRIRKVDATLGVIALAPRDHLQIIDHYDTDELIERVRSTETFCFVGRGTTVERCGSLSHYLPSGYTLTRFEVGPPYTPPRRRMLDVFCLSLPGNVGMLPGDSGAPVYARVADHPLPDPSDPVDIWGAGMMVGNLTVENDGVTRELACFQSLEWLEQDLRVQILHDDWEDPGEPDGDSDQPVPSGDGRYVVFQSDAMNLVADDTNAAQDIFMRDNVDGTLNRISVNSAEQQANGSSSLKAVTPNGQYVLFQSTAANLVANDTTGEDVYVRDTVAGTTSRVSIDPDGRPMTGRVVGQSISPTGLHITLDHLGADGINRVYLRNRSNLTTTQVSVSSTGQPANAGSGLGVVSETGRYVAFVSHATNLVPGDTNNAPDVFLRDVTLNTTTRVSVGAGGVQANAGVESIGLAVSATGHVAFTSWSSNLVAGDTNGTRDVFLRDPDAGTTVRVSVGAGGQQANGPSGGVLYDLHMSNGGRYVAFNSMASNLVSGDTNGAEDVFVRDLVANTTVRASLGSTGQQYTSAASPRVEGMGLSSDGRHVAFATAAKLAPSDVNGWIDVYLRDIGDSTTTHVSDSP